jgi:hypothetical protein
VLCYDEDTENDDDGGGKIEREEKRKRRNVLLYRDCTYSALDAYPTRTPFSHSFLIEGS